jgi:hypothetical protein
VERRAQNVPLAWRARRPLEIVSGRDIRVARLGGREIAEMEAASRLGFEEQAEANIPIAPQGEGERLRPFRPQAMQG